MKKFWGMLKATFSDFGEDRAMRLSAAMAYYSIFSIGPLLFVLVTIAGWVFGDEAVRGQVHDYLHGIVGSESAKAVESMMAGPKQNGNLLTSILAIVTLLIGASGVFGQLQDALNTIWEVKPKSGLGVWGFLRTRFLSMAMVLGLGFLLLVSLIMTTAAQALASGAGQLLPIPDAVLGTLSMLTAFAVVTLFFAAIYKVLPDVKVRWRDVWMGAMFAAALFTVGKFLLSLYLGKQATSSTYGAAGSFVVILLWVYYASIILFLGAEFTQVYAREHGAAIVPTANAEPVSEQARAQQGLSSGATSGARPSGAPAVRERPRPIVPAATRPRPAYAMWAGFGLLAGWWFRRRGRGA